MCGPACGRAASGGASSNREAPEEAGITAEGSRGGTAEGMGGGSSEGMRVAGGQQESPGGGPGAS